MQDLGDEVRQGLVADEQRLIAEWKADGTMQIVDDVDVDAFRKRAKEYFSKGFAFSELYNKITADPGSPSAAVESGQ